MKTLLRTWNRIRSRVLGGTTAVTPTTEGLDYTLDFALE